MCNHINRRKFLQTGIAGALALNTEIASRASANEKKTNKTGKSVGKKVLILGIDGLDPNLLTQFMQEGVLPNFSKLAKEGSFSKLATMMAPQSPVAWSTFITGLDPGGHGIYDFITRDPDLLVPQFSMAKTTPPKHVLNLGDWVLPLSSGKVEMMRKGKAFWQILGEHGVPTTVFRMPVNFPPVEAKLNKAISGMGTPDITGTPGTYSFFTTKLPANYQDIQGKGGNVYPVQIKDNRVEAKLVGPENAFRRQPKSSPRNRVRRAAQTVEYEHPKCTRDFTVYIDYEAKAAKIVVGNEEFILKEKEWSDWKRVDFEAVPYLVTVNSMGLFYLKQLEPEFQLYVSPLQISPENPAMPISNPPNFSKELCECIGYFYTKELPEDNKALTHGVFSGQDFWDQAMIVYEEGVKALKYLISQFDDGMLFLYFGTVDQGCHMLWRYMDHNHPYFIQDDFLSNGIRNIYQKMDDVLGYVMQGIDKDTTLIVMSDHGFAPFYRQFNLNSWLLEKGYAKLKNPALRGQSNYFMNVDWSGTQAYGVGLNGLYVNRKGREKYGIVEQGDEYDKLIQQLKSDLLSIVDPQNGKQVVSLVVHPPQDFHGDYKDQGPDLMVGYNRGYRVSWESPLGKFPQDIFLDNNEAWSGDHCIDNRIVPGVLMTNQRITMDFPALYDLTVAVLNEFGVPPLPEMIGRNCLAPFAEKKPIAQKEE